LQAIFDRDPYESRRSALPGARLVKVLVVYQMIHTAKLRGLIRALSPNIPVCKGQWAERWLSIPCPMALPKRTDDIHFS
jgi:hypothetical protein